MPDRLIVQYPSEIAADHKTSHTGVSAKKFVRDGNDPDIGATNAGEDRWKEIMQYRGPVGTRQNAHRRVFPRSKDHYAVVPAIVPAVRTSDGSCGPVSVGRGTLDPGKKPARHICRLRCV